MLNHEIHEIHEKVLRVGFGVCDLGGVGLLNHEIHEIHEKVLRKGFWCMNLEMCGYE